MLVPIFLATALLLLMEKAVVLVALAATADSLVAVIPVQKLVVAGLYHQSRAVVVAVVVAAQAVTAVQSWFTTGEATPRLAGHYTTAVQAVAVAVAAVQDSLVQDILAVKLDVDGLIHQQQAADPVGQQLLARPDFISTFIVKQIGGLICL
jgi:hypothetical protein